MLLGIKLSIAAVALAGCTVVQDFVVNTTDDTTDANPGDGACADALGACSLRAAIQEANSGSTVGTILLQAGQTYDLTILATGGDPAASGGLHISSEVTISTDGAGQATIDASAIDDRVLTVTGAPDSVTLTDLNITGASSTASAALEIENTLRVNLERVRIHHNDTAAINNIGTGTLEIRNSTIDNNAGGNFFATIFNLGSLELFQATIADNNAIAISSMGSSIDIEATTITGAGPAIDAQLDAVTIARSALDTTGDDCAASSLVSDGDNVFSDSSCSPASSDTTNSTGNLKPLADNGGPVPTQLPNAFGAAHDRIPCADGTGPDARGIERPAGDLCDRGAAEALPTEATGAACFGDFLFGPNADFAKCDFSGLFLDEVATEASFFRANLSDVRLSGDFAGANFNEANLSGSTLDGLDLADSSAVAADFSSSTLIGSDLRRANLTGSNFTGANLAGANLTGAVLTNVNLTGADLSGALVSSATFTAATWANTVCPDGVISDANGGTCAGHL